MADSQFESLMILADRDIETVRQIAHARKLRSIAFFHVQQALEKTFKAVLSANSIAYPLTHSLLKLKRLLASLSINCPVDDQTLEYIDPFAVEARYDEEIEPQLSVDAALALLATVTLWAEQFRPSVA